MVNGKLFFRILVNPTYSIQDGTKVVGAGADKTARMLDVNANNAQQVAAHDESVKCVRMFEANSTLMLVTGSWDKTIKYWDLRQAKAVGSITCQDRVHAMDVKDDLLVVVTAERHLNVVNLADPFTFYKTITSKHRWQMRVASCFVEASGFAVGTINGHCATQYVEDRDNNLSFKFKCHRDDLYAYSVNDISWHPIHGTFSTAGSDGTFHFWDKDATCRLKAYPDVGGPIVSTSFSHMGDFFAYAISYNSAWDFLPSKIMLHLVTSNECDPR
jgi:mRNA export factor